MNYEIRDCIDAGTEYCPCHLAETNDCILCSQLSGKNFCDCINWKGVCIYQEYIWNGNTAKKERKNYLCNVINKQNVNEGTSIFTIKVTHKLASDLIYPGSYIFIRNPQCMQFYDAPISVMESNTEENQIKVAVELNGTKTRSINQVSEGEKVLIRGPFWNGVLGLKNIYKTKNSKVLVVLRGIGQAPAVQVIKKLYSNANEITVVVDKGQYDDIFVKEYLDKYSCKVVECKIMDKGKLTTQFKELLQSALKKQEFNLIHCAGPDKLSYEIINIINDLVLFSCCNNGRMCCGEGICGSCTVKTNDHKLRRLCKLQTDPGYILKGRRKL